MVTSIHTCTHTCLCLWRVRGAHGDILALSSGLSHHVAGRKLRIAARGAHLGEDYGWGQGSGQVQG